MKLVCPHGAGVKNYLPAAYNPTSKVVFAPLTEACMDVFPIPGGEGRGALSSGVNWGIRPRPDSDGKYGRVQAINLETRKTVWTTRDRAPQTSGVLATAGGVVFAGAFDRFIRAYDDANGKVLWETRLNDVSSSTPITYSVDGKQYIAVVTGQGGFHASSYAVLVPGAGEPARSRLDALGVWIALGVVTFTIFGFCEALGAPRPPHLRPLEPRTRTTGWRVRKDPPYALEPSNRFPSPRCHQLVMRMPARPG